MPRDQLDDPDQAVSQASQPEPPSLQRGQVVLAAQLERARWARAAAKAWSDSALPLASR